MSISNPLAGFTPEVATWFATTFDAPTAAQRAAWPAIGQGGDVLVAAPTGSGKTFAAFLWAIDGLARRAAIGRLGRHCRVLYVSPLKALSNDIRRNLQEPLLAIQPRMGPLGDAIEAAVRTGDTPAAARERMRRHPPHILVTTPESLYLLLTAESGRRLLAPVETVIVDELHAVAGSKRGAHLALSLERLAALADGPVQRIGLSATQRPVERMAHFLAGAGRPLPAIVDLGHVRRRDLAIEMPRSPLGPVMATEVWDEIYDRIAALAGPERATLVFVNTRRLAERAGRRLAERLGEAMVAVHHGSLSRAEREGAEQRLKAGSLKVLVATASLELGIDIGEVDLVCQLGSPRAIATFIQRVGRSGHRLDAVPKGRLFPLSMDDLTECAALLEAVSHDVLEESVIMRGALDVLAQQIVAEVAGAGEYRLDELYEILHRAWPYRDFSEDEFKSIVDMLAHGFTSRRGRRLAHLAWERTGNILRARRGARRFALENGGVIPDQFDYDVRLLPENLPVGTLNEDFAFESAAGDVFQLGNRSYQIRKVEQGTVYVDDANGAPPTIPFWFGEAPGRSRELSRAVSGLLQRAENTLADKSLAELAKTLASIPGVGEIAGLALAAHLAEAAGCLGGLPREDRLILERFFDQVGDQHLVVHSPLGIRLNRALGLTLRKRFCRRFNFELQASADDNAVLLSLGPTHSFALEEVADYLRAAQVRAVLTQAVLAAPMFPARWRWVAGTALALARRRGGRRLPAPFQRADAEDLVALVFPDQLACQENLAGERAVPDHPLVAQTLTECLEEVMDVVGLEALLAARERGEVQIVACDLAEPSPLARGIINARPWAFLDGGAAEERRTRAVAPARDFVWARGLGAADPELIARLRREAWPRLTTSEELADALAILGCVTELEGCTAEAEPAFEALVDEGRATTLDTPTGVRLWISAERLSEWQAVFPEARLGLLPTSAISSLPDERQALRDLLRSRLGGLGPVSVQTVAAPLGLSVEQTRTALLGLEADGSVLRGHFDPQVAETTWCERHLAARLARLSVERRRTETCLASPAAFERFLLHWQGVEGEGEGVAALAALLTRLAGWQAPALLWDAGILPVRLAAYRPEDLDALVTRGRLAWARLTAPGAAARAGSLARIPIAFMPREHLSAWLAAAGPPSPLQDAAARRIEALLRARGASFFSELLTASSLLPSALEEALTLLIRSGRVSADGTLALRLLSRPASRRRSVDLQEAGRFVHLSRPERALDWTPDLAQFFARMLLERYGIVFRLLAARDPLMPPWRELLRAFWRLEAQGEISGGRFVAGVAGEQFARPDAVPLLKCEADGADRRQVLFAADPANVASVFAPAPALAPDARLLFCGGVAVAALDKGRYRAFTLEAEQRRVAFERELRGTSFSTPARRASGGIRAQLRTISIAGHRRVRGV